MSNSSGSRVRLGAVALAVAGILFVLYPAVRPWEDESTADGALAAMTSWAWLASHLFAMIGFILVGLGLLALRQAVNRTPAERTALAAVVIGWVGAGLTLPFYGAETFGLHAVAGRADAGEQFDLLQMIDDVRFGAAAVITFAIGLIGLGVAALLAAIAVRRSAVLPRYSGLLFAVGFVLFIPQFFTPPVVRITHGVVLGVGAVWLAAGLWRSTSGVRP